MSKLTCPRCQSRFYSAYTKHDINCPYCGFYFENVDQQRRVGKRTPIQKDCGLQMGEVSIKAQTVDISSSGLGVLLFQNAPFGKNTTVHVIVEDFDIESYAQVMWVNQFEDNLSRAGLRFC